MLRAFFEWAPNVLVSSGDLDDAALVEVQVLCSPLTYRIDRPGYSGEDRQEQGKPDNANLDKRKRDEHNDAHWHPKDQESGSALTRTLP